MKPIRVCQSNAYEASVALMPLVDNPRKPLTKSQQADLDKSIFELGLFRPLLVWRGEAGTDEPVVIGGNQRLRRLKELVDAGHPLVFKHDGSPADGVPITDYVGDEASARLVALRDNNSDGDWDWSSLAAFTASLDALDVDMDLSGFDTDFLDDLSAYGSGDESKVMDAAARDPAPEREPEPDPDDDRKTASDVSDEDQKVIGVVIGHVRGRLTAPTYRRLIAALALEVDEKQSEGLDAAMSRMLDHVDGGEVMA